MWTSLELNMIYMYKKFWSYMSNIGEDIMHRNQYLDHTRFDSKTTTIETCDNITCYNNQKI